MKDRWVHLRMSLICGRVVFYVKDLQRSLMFYREEDTLSRTNPQQRLNDLFGYIRQGKINEAMNEFYDRNRVMQDYARHRITRFP